jgi:AcrR family transcriptional regulator
VKHSEIKQKILVTASELFYKNGYNLTGINQIISESGVAKATLYNHFKSKDDICVAYLQLKNSAFLEDVKLYCNAQPEGKQRIIAIFDFLNEFFNTQEFNGCWCINTVAEIPRENKKIRSEIVRQKELFLDVITELVEENLISLKRNEIKNTARQTYLLYEGAVAESHLHNTDWPIKEAKNLCSQIIV